MIDRQDVDVDELLADIQAEYDEEERALRRPAWLSGRVQSLNELDHKDIPELSWVVPDLLTEGFTVLAGMLKSGKSYLILNIGLAIAEGLPVLGQTKAKQGRVLYITPDDKQEARLRARIRALRGDRTDDIPFDIATTWTPLDEGGIEEIGEYLDYYPDTKLVIIDVLMSVLPGIKEDADAYDKIYHKLVPLKDMAQEHHVAIVPVMHMNKGQNGGNPRNRIYGSMAYGAIADNILLLDEDYSTHQRFLLTSGKDLEQGRHALAFETNTGRYTYGEERIAELQEKDTVQEIGDIVKEYPGITRRELMVRLGLSANTLDQRIYRAKQAGKVCTDGTKAGYYPCSVASVSVDTQPPTDDDDPD